MGKKVTFELNLPGLNELMKSKEMQGALDEAGQAVAQAAGEGYEVENKTGRYIAFSNVSPESQAAKKDNYENNTLLKAVGSVGLKMKK